MNGAAMLLPKFFVLCSVILILTGVAQYFVRPRRPKESLPEKLVNRATITALLSIAVGVAGLLIGLGIVPMPRFH
ncbi:MAG TPA: hypothetical protein VH853_16790 [Polyangia bacterium]|nr:hypothetical protein [Polyangia bacterium]